MYEKETRRTKVVTFRISAEEFHALEAARSAHRLKSISDLTRDAVQQWIHGCGSDSAAPAAPLTPSARLETELECVENCIHVLTKELERLHRLVELERESSAAQA